VRRRYEIRRTFRAAPEEVWRLVSDHESYRDWTALTRSYLEEEGHPHRDGVGALRYLGVGRIGSRERVVEFDPPRRLAYTIESGVPVRDFLAEVVLEPAPGGGTELTWSGGFTSAPPGLGPILLVGLRTAVADFVRRMGRRLD
jgi:uncharacterized protein YndB with AHSA1/START domain